MDPLGHHAILKLRDGRVLAKNAPWRRRVAHAILTRGHQHRLLAFRLADTHLHLATLADAATTNELARRAEISLTKRRPTQPGFAKVYVKPIRDQNHLQNLFRYILHQHDHHAITTDPRHEAGNLPDLLGLRTTGAYTRTAVREALPRVTRADLLKALGVNDLQPADGPLDHLPDAAAAAVALPTLTNRRPTKEAHAARTAAVHVAADRLRAKDLAALLGVSTSTIRRLRATPPDPAIVEAIRLQLGLRQALSRPA